MKFLIYKSTKQQDFILIEKICSYLQDKGIDYQVISENDLKKNLSANAIIVLGGDGTILRLVTFSLKNSIPILSINTGDMGFLTEFEKDDYIDAIDMVLSNEYNEDNRAVLTVLYKDKTFFALNDAVVQRKYSDNYTNLVVKISAFIDDNFIDDIKGDGVIVSTPTGSTAYSLSAGGSILSPNIMANTLTPICAHSFHNRPIIFSSNSKCELRVKSGSLSALYIDGKFEGDVCVDDSVIVMPSTKNITFLRKKDNNFYKKLLTKFNRGK